MTEQGNTFVVELPKGTVTIHKDLKKYLDIRTRLFQESEQEKAILNKQIEPKEIVDKVSLRLIDYVQTKLIASLSQYGLYDLTTEDFLLENPGYHAFIAAAQKHYNYATELSDALNETAAQSRAAAADAANQQITGMGFGVISNDIVAHVLYAIQSKTVLEKQTAQAQANYRSAVSAINSSTEHAIQSGVTDNQKNQFVPEATASINQIFEYLLSKYCDCLEQTGQFDSICLSEIDEARSNSVLNNLAVVSDKEAVICKAIQLCPFNLAAYHALYTEGYLCFPSYRDILSYLGLTDIFCDRLIQAYGLDPDNEVLENYQKSRSLLKIIAFLKSTDEVSAAHKVFEKQFFADLSSYTNLAQIIKNKKSVRLGFPKYKSVDAAAFSEVLANALPSYHISNDIVMFYKSIGWDVFSALSDSFGTEICLFDDADAQIINAWNLEKNKAIIKSLDKKIEKKKVSIVNVQKRADDVIRQKNLMLTCGGAVIALFMVSPLIMEIDASQFFQFPVIILFGIAVCVFGAWTIGTARKNLNEIKQEIKKTNSEIAALEREKSQYI